MKQQYKDLGQTIGRYRCVGINQHDKCLSGKLGEIWEGNDTGTMFAFRVLPSGNEKLISFNIKELSKWVSKLQVPRNINKQLYWANNPNTRFNKQ